MSLRALPLLAVTALSLGVGAGCNDSDCASADPGFQLELSADPAVAIRSLVIELSLQGRTFERTYELSGELSDGRTSVAVLLDPAPEETVDLALSVRGHEATGGEGPALASAAGSFRATPDGCNVLSLALRPPERADAGIPDSGEVLDAAAGFDAGDRDAGEQADAAEDASTADARDAALPDAVTPDATGPDATLADAAAPDAATPDAATPDAAMSDAGVVETSTCAGTADAATLALYTFEADPPGVISDRTGNHPGVRSGRVATVPGPAGCGSAIEFTALTSTAGFAEIPDDPAWDLSTGSIDFWVRFDENTTTYPEVMLSRDAIGFAAPGHLGFYRSCDGTIVARLQRNGQSAHLCADAPTPQGVWTHVALNFGAPRVELFIDGARTTTTRQIGLSGRLCSSMTVACGSVVDWGIEGNDNPWVLGSGTHIAVEGTGRPLDGYIRGGALDSVRISSQRRAF